MASGGSIQQVSIRGRIFPVAADADANRDLGGFTNAIEANGDGSARIIKTRQPWNISGISLVCDDTNGDQEFLQEIADGFEFVDFTITLANGKVYQGVGMPTDKIEMSTHKVTVPLTFSGPKKMEPQ